MELITRAKNILIDPRSEWSAIARQPDDPIFLLRYVAILAAIPAIAGFVGLSIFGISVSAGTFRIPLAAGLVNAVLSYLLSFVIVYVVALVVDALAPSFDAERGFSHALRLSVYSFTPSWLAGVFLLVPGLRFLTILGIYGLYLIWTGLPPMMHAPRSKATIYAAAVVIGAIVVTVVLSILQTGVISLLFGDIGL